MAGEKHASVRVGTYSEALSALRRCDAAGIELAGVEDFGDRGLDGGPGVWAALSQFLRSDPRWSVIRVSADTVFLSRDPGDKPALPPRAVQAWNYAVAKLGELFHGRRLVPEAVAEGRMSHCWVCPSRVDNRCSRCGCYLDKIPDDAPVDAGHPGKAWRADERCPVLLWPKYKPPRTG